MYLHFFPKYSCSHNAIFTTAKSFFTSIQTIDGIDISDYNLKWLRSQISIVSQEPVLFAKTIRENITYGMILDDNAPVSQTLVEESAKNANIHDFIMTLPLVSEYF